jgi:hypothetical protein
MLLSATQCALLILARDHRERLATQPIMVGDRSFEPRPRIEKIALIAPPPKQPRRLIERELQPLRSRRAGQVFYLRRLLDRSRLAEDHQTSSWLCGSRTQQPGQPDHISLKFGVEFGCSRLKLSTITASLLRPLSTFADYSGTTHSASARAALRNRSSA